MVSDLLASYIGFFLGEERARFYLACIYLLAESPEILSIFREGLQYVDGCCLKLGQFCGLGFFLFKRDSWLSLWQTLLPKILLKMMGKLSYSHPQVKQSASCCLFCCLSMGWQLALKHVWLCLNLKTRFASFIVDSDYAVLAVEVVQAFVATVSAWLIFQLPNPIVSMFVWILNHN